MTALTTNRKSTEAFFTRLAAAQRPLLLLDYDGTLAPFQDDRHLAMPSPGVRERLELLQRETRTRVVIVTGRMVHDMPPLLTMDPHPDIYGAHGWERLYSDGRHVVMPASADVAPRLEVAHRWVVENGHEQRCELKAASLTMHWRSMPPEAAASLERDVRAAWEPLAHAGLDLHPFEGGVELRSLARHKGTATEELIHEHQADAVAFLGDDVTDEDAFRVLAALPLSMAVLVRDEPRPSVADVCISPGQQVLDFLDQWIQATSHTAARSDHV